MVLAAASLAEAQAWTPPPPDPGAFDWIRLGSGEWLGGEIKNMRSEKIEFDSDELDVLTLDWDDVAELRSPNLYTYVFEGRVAVRGTASLREGQIVISGEGSTRTYPRSQLLSIIPGGTRERDLWSLNLHLGLVTRSGNTDQQDLTAMTRIRRAGALTRLGLDYAGNFGRLAGEQNTNNHTGDGRLDVFLSNRFYLTPVAMNVSSDKFQNIDLRLTPSVGFGVTVVETKRVTLDAELGGGYQWTRFRSVQAGEDDTADQGSIIPGLSLETEPTDDIDFDFNYNVRIGVPETKDTYHHLLGIFSLELTDIFDFEFSFTWDRVESPRPDADGVVPKRDDFRTSFGLGIEL